MKQKNKPLRKFFGGLFGLGAAVVTTVGTAQDASSEEEVFELSPFEVKHSENDIGYYSENTLAGSRLNSSISDLASSITVVTDQQLEDTAAVDINDVFLYEANTEGLGNYTAYGVDKSGAIDDVGAGKSNGNIASGPGVANRVRGIAPADTARDYFPSIARIPFDAYNTRTIEINRGPNSILFGLGSAAGIVNQSQDKAVIGDEFGRVEARIGSWGAKRFGLSYNKPLLDNKLAVYVAALHEEKGFRRKPSKDETDRQYLSITAQPWERTTIRANYENYENEAQRPNNVTPRDLVTPWRQAGSPAWNPIERTYTVNGTSYGPIDSNSDLPDGLAVPSGRPLFVFDQGEFQQAYQRSLSTNPNEVNGNSVYRMLTSSGSIDQPLFIYPGVTDQSVYDWEEINIVSSNVGNSDASIASFELDQQIMPNLYLNLGYYDESYEANNSYFIGQQTGATIEIDPNTHLLDGSPNPYFGHPFVEIREPDRFLQTENNTVMRATLAYELDFTETDGITRHLGSHRAMALASSREYDNTGYRFRQVTHSDNPWVNQENLTAGTGGAVYRRMYLGGADGNVSYSPGIVINENRNFQMPVAYPDSAVAADASLDNWTWTTESVRTDETLHFVSGSNEQETDSTAFVLQSAFWEDRIVTTLGWRTDDNRGRSSVFPTIDPATGEAYPEDVGTEWNDWQEVSGDTSTAGIVFKPTEWLNFHYNESDNFTPEGVVYDISTGEPLPLPTGEGKDWGVGVNLFEGKLYANLNFFETGQLNSRVGGTGTFIWRMGYFDEDFFGDWASYVAQEEGLEGAAAEARVAEITQYPENYAQYNDSVLGTSTLESEGVELQVIYNPLPNWNFKFNVAQQETVFSDIAPEYYRWREERLALWQSASSDALPEGFQSFWDYDNDNAPFDIGTKRNALHGVLNTPEKWFNANVDSQMALQTTLAGKATPGQREWRWNAITNYQFMNGPLQGVGIGGSARWEDSAIIGYLGAPADPDGVIRRLDGDKPVYSGEEFHVDLWASYTMPVMSDKATLKFQLNVRDALEDGGLQPIAVNPDGQKTAFRIVDPRQFFFTTSLEF
ncbi:hypothetical protein [Pelagicoccus sp. SDUM812003]|uniref:hypothetical protein n=1 Tax=Pelagicoccus sp. SDUM812003 TaxID=3041267 RepID=UPI00280FAC9D|nr:hypothetical protein [Pelagicoccus sp. SDUM812003]MDQ8205525.1 hypothetical protein [Pelagicoccus sp. SDUM812003]